MSKSRKSEKRTSMLEGITTDLETKGDIKNSFIETAKDVVVGAIGGSLVGAVIGKFSLAVGAAVTGIGHYTKSRLTSIFGVGMMAGGSLFNPNQTVNGKEDGDALEGAKDRALAFKDNLKHRLGLDNLFKSDQELEQQNGDDNSTVGEVKYFEYMPSETPKEKELEGADIDLTSLDHFQQKVVESANAYKQNEEDKKAEAVSGELPESDMKSLEERIY
jgi:hypothetical protein